MPKGVKRIELIKGALMPFGMDKSLTILSQRVTIKPDTYAEFRVAEWLPDTTEDEKKEDVYWMRQTQDRSIIKYKAKHTNFKFKIPKKYCGPYSYYIEASRSGNQDFKNPAGLYVNGHSMPLIKASDWRAQEDGRDIKNAEDIGYGDLIYLWLETEGLNGDSITVEIYNDTLGDDDFIHRYTNVKVNSGEVKVKIGNTYLWRSKISYWVSDIEQFYIKAKDKSGNYIKDHLGDDKHAIYLKINDKIVKKGVELSENLTPTKVFKPDANFTKDEPCKFTAIDITEQGAPKPISVFKEGQVLPLTADNVNTIGRVVYFDFDKSDINAETAEKLNNILTFLLKYPGTSIKLSGYACVIGKEAYNKELSQKRSDAIKDFFAKGKLEAGRITSVGYGEKNITDDDSIKHINEKDYIEARRVDIVFDFAVHSALIYETIAPSSPKNITIDVTGFDTKDCFRDTKKHKKEIIVVSPDASEKTGGISLQVPIQSTLSAANPFPLQYIWPRYNLIRGENKDAAALYNAHVHSCRYFFNAYSPAVIIKAYPDIKWDFHFFLNLSNKLSVKWQNLSPAEHKKMQSNAGKIGAEKRWKQIDIDFGVVLAAKWDKNEGTSNYGSELDLTLKWEDKIKRFYEVFAHIKEFSKFVTGKTKGTVAKSRLGKKLPIKIFMNPPNFCLGADWQLARGQENEKKTTEIGTELEFYFKAEPLIELGVVIDLLGGLIQLGVAAVSGGAANMAAMTIYNEIKDWLGDDDNAFTLKIYIDLEIKGTINGESKFKLNTASDANKGEAKLETVLSVELKAGIEVKAAVVIIIGEAYIEAEASVSGKASVTFGHGLYYKQASSTKKELYYAPKLDFDGLKVTAVVKAKIGLEIKKGWFKGDYDKDLVDYKAEKILFKPFDVLKEITGRDIKIQLID